MAGVERTVAFVDLVGFTTLTDVHGDVEAVHVLDRFVGDVTSVLGRSDELVKSIGDAVMLVSPGPRDAIGLLGRVLEAAHAQHHFPDLRCGVHHGPVLARDDDYFGSTVNLAARLAAMAGPDQVLGTGSVADAARDAGVEVHPLGRRQVRGLQHEVDIFDLVLCETEHDTVFDPVCRTRLDPQRAVGRIRHADREHWFCSLECVRAFTDAPDRYA